ncbi:lipoprotein signal peptidase [Planctomycetales bacterium]|nr:lipoprotein signal peptidase [Planctomycetales bacterium]GHS96191.1 lipoprotein signal peptidase [Planctomycetales bacterium]GHT04242.1 lipoprotein signal peptidase [Planctomycetales bacterium]
MRYFWLIAALTAALDLGSKHAVFAWLATRGVFDLIPGYLSFTRHINEGALWGLGSGAPLALLLLTAAMMAVVTWLAWSHRRKPAPLWALGLILGGAVGNFYDRGLTTAELYGERLSGVRDFIWMRVPDVYSWPVYNLADVAIVVGVARFALWSFRAPPPPPPPPSAPSA